MAELPGGTVTFFFTDVEGSTRMVRELGDERWADLLDTHRKLVREAVSANHGREFGTQGDALFVAFAKASDASAAAVTAQRALHSHDWPDGLGVRIRIGLHSGEAVIHGDNYVGKEVHRASRICDAGHGGQILISERTVALMREDMAPEWSLVDLGEHRLKDMGKAERLFQISAPGLEHKFAQLRSRSAPSNLAGSRSSFVGREKEVATVRARLEQERLVSLTGIGGSGKTRIASEVGSQELMRFADGVFFIDLAPLSDPELIAQAAAAACAESIGDIMRGDIGGSIEDRLVHALSDRTCLLIVDNCEHLIDDVADFLDRVLSECANVSLLATSREALGIEGEQVVPVPSLSVPTDDSDSAGDTDAVKLFVARAQSVKPDFSLHSDNREAVFEICRRLDGIPLAIELAATRVAHLSVQQIADRLEDRFRLLTGGRRRVQRQQTLSAALDWSHELLSEEERIMLRRLAVFSGGFTLEAAEAITSSEGAPTTDAIEAVASLVAKSLVVVSDDDGGGTRYQLLETVRMYASDKLAQAGEAEALRTQHRDWYLASLESVPLERLSASAATVFAVSKEIDNLRAAAAWSVSMDEPAALGRLASHLRDYWNSGPYLEGRRWLLEALESSERLTVEERVACHAAVVFVAGTGLNREEGREHASIAIELAAGKPSSSLVVAYGSRGFLTSILASAPGMPEELVEEARRDCAAAVDVAQQGLDREWRVRAASMFAMTEATLGDPSAAAKWYGEVLSLVPRDGEPHVLLGQALAGVSLSKLVLGEIDAAVAASMDAISRGTFDEGFNRLFRSEVTPALVAGGHESVALEILREEFESVRRPGVPLVENHALGVAAAVEYLRGRPERAGRLLGASRSLGGARGTEIPFRTPGNVALYRHYRPLIRAALGRDEARLARAEGEAMSRDEALAYAVEGLEDASSVEPGTPTS